METQNKPSSKQEAIIKAYGEHWGTVKDYVDENGNFDKRYFFRQKELKYSVFNIDFEHFADFTARPKSLQGIENNNGWISIESEKDLPSDEHRDYYTGRFIDDVFALNEGIYDCHEVKFCFQNNYITHYRLIENPPLPIY